MNYSNMTVPQLLMMLNPGAANTTYLQPNQEAMLRNQSISPYTPQGNVQMPNMQPLNIEGLLGSILGTAGVQGAMAGANVGSGPMTDADNDRIIVDPRTGRRYPVNPAVGSGAMTDTDAVMLQRLYNPATGAYTGVR